MDENYIKRVEAWASNVHKLVDLIYSSITPDIKKKAIDLAEEGRELEMQARPKENVSIYPESRIATDEEVYFSDMTLDSHKEWRFLDYLGKLFRKYK